MPSTLNIRDENIAGQPLRDWALEVLTERITVRELILSRVYQEVQDYNQKQGPVFQGLIEPEEAERALNGWKLKKPRLLDWQKQFQRAIEAFEALQVLILVGDKQAESLDEEVVITPGMTVTFVRLTPLAGG